VNVKVALSWYELLVVVLSPVLDVWWYILLAMIPP